MTITLSSRISRTIVIIAAMLAVVSTALAAPKGLKELGKAIQKKPTYVLTNTPLSGRLKALVDEFKLQNALEVDTASDSVSNTQLDKASILVLQDREAGNLPFELEFVVGAFRSNDAYIRLPSSDAALMVVIERDRGFRTLFVSAPTRESLIDFISRDLAGQNEGWKFWQENFLRLRKPVRPAAPQVISPLNSVNASRPPIFFLARPYPTKVIGYTVQVSAPGQERDVAPNELGAGNSTSSLPGGGYVDVDAVVRPASRVELDTWKVTVPKDLARRNQLVYVYYPEFDLPPGKQYSARVQLRFLDEPDSKPGPWSSADFRTEFSVAPQPANLEVATQITEPRDWDCLYPSFSPDGQSILYAANRSGRRLFEIYSDSATSIGSGTYRVTLTNRGSSDRQAVWGPIDKDGVMYVTFCRIDRKEDKSFAWNLWQVAVPTERAKDVPAGMTRLTNGPEASYQPVVSSKGTLAYVRDDGRGGSEIWIQEPGSNPKALCQGVDPAWDPDGETLYYSSNDSGTWDIYKRGTRRGGNPIQLTNDPGSERFPSPNPKTPGRLVYVSTANGNSDIWILKNGTGTRLTEWIGEDLHPTWSPDGKDIVYCTTRFNEAFRRYVIAKITVG